MDCKLLLPVLLLFGLSISCSKKSEDIMKPCSDNLPSLTAIQRTFLDICFGNEFGQDYERLRKWREDMVIFIPQPDPTLEAELERIMQELNSLSASTRVSRTNIESESNFILFFGDKDDYVQDYAPEASDLITTNRGLFAVSWNPNTYLISGGSACIDNVNETNTNCQKHLLREEITQALGMMNDIGQYNDSIFYSQYTCTPSYSDQDRDYIRDFLRADLKAGMCRGEVVRILF